MTRVIQIKLKDRWRDVIIYPENVGLPTIWDYHGRLVKAHPFAKVRLVERRETELTR